ncbi:MAG: diguanylate cyclase [Caloramator sp.]|jgi:diguanylate cyclase (GGDEF)-like protein|uniref:diguanylate cyclase n=1 Tax=Caloramator sp. TaxID=1871330 RepID=UPI001D5EE198|nr:diguanylate cyclase [Caloramator sp.]MBZ4664621.1 diguanylate cyclase [Caloramator sp.]
MYKEDFETNGIIRIVMNQEHKIQYSSINNQETYNYLKKLDILEKLPEYSSVQYNSGNYCVAIDKLYIADQPYHIITIALRHHKCSNCSKAFIDAPTGLYNRNYWEQISNGTIYHPGIKEYSLILIDIDSLKKINDTYGHLAGDKAIEIVGQAIKRSIRKEDLGIRYGGDEFIVLLFNQDRKAAYKVVKRIRKEISKRTIEENLDIQISAGIACCDYLSDLEEIVKMADKDMYREKEIKKEQKVQTNTLKDLREEIEKIRNELNKRVIQEGKGINNEETLKLSQKLDELIAKYLKNEK